MTSLNELRKAAYELEKYGKRLVREIGKAEVDTAKVGLRVAVKQSSGKVSSLQLRREGHPYARRHGKPKRDPQIINSQSGEFRREWHIALGKNLDEGPAIVNFSSIAGFLQEGTPKMFARPVENVVIAELRKIRPANLAKAIERASTKS